MKLITLACCVSGEIRNERDTLIVYFLHIYFERTGHAVLKRGANKGQKNHKLKLRIHRVEA